MEDQGLADTFPVVTSGAVNPTSIIQALPPYIGDRTKTNIANLFG